MRSDQRKGILAVAVDIDERVADLDDIIFSLGEVRDEYEHMSNDWIRRNAEINIVQTYKDQIIKQGKRLRKLI
jgi:hypothetical protein